MQAVVVEKENTYLLKQSARSLKKSGQLENRHEDRFTGARQYLKIVSAEEQCTRPKETSGPF